MLQTILRITMLYIFVRVNIVELKLMESLPHREIWDRHQHYPIILIFLLEIEIIKKDKILTCILKTIF